jgi:polysaccharide lyase-like protein
MTFRCHDAPRVVRAPRAAAALALLLVVAGAGSTASAAGHTYRPVRITDRTATFAVGGLAGRDVVSARLTAAGRASRGVAVARIDRSARSPSGVLRVSLPRSWRPAGRAKRLRIRLRVHSRPACGGQPGKPSSCGKVLWRADAERATASEWASNSSVPEASSPAQPDTSRIARSSFRAQGADSYRFEMRDGDDSFGERAELGQALPAAVAFENRWFRAGQERWIAMQYYFPADWPSDDTWQTVFQIKPVAPGGGGPDIGIDAGGNRLSFYGNTNEWGSTAGKLFYGDGSLPERGYPLTRGHWIKLTWHIVFSADPKVGSLEAFGDLADGKGMRTVIPRRHTATMKYLNGAMDPVHLRVGIYRDPAMTATEHLYVDGITVATTRAAAEANAYAGISPVAFLGNMAATYQLAMRAG